MYKQNLLNTPNKLFDSANWMYSIVLRKTDNVDSFFFQIIIVTNKVNYFIVN